MFPPRVLLRALLGACLLGAGVASQAATITWQTPTTIAGASDAYLGGTTKYAFTWGTFSSFDNGEVNFTNTSVTNGTTGDGNLTVSGFTARNQSLSSFSTPYANLPSAYKNVLQGGAADSVGATCSLTLNNLTPGVNYALQVWIQDPTGSNGTTNRYATVANTAGDGGAGVNLVYNTTAVAGGLGQYVVGTFTADATTTQSFTVQGGVISGQSGTPATQINCFQLRDLTPVPAETPTFNLPTAPTYFGAQNITVSSEIASTVYYTTDGSTPDTNSSPSGAPGSGFAIVSIPAGATTAIKAIATADAKFKTVSAEGDATYTTSASTVATWTNTAGGSWPNAANWAGGVIAFGPNATADFSTLSLSGPVTVTLDGSRTNGNMWFDDQSHNTNSWTLTNGTVNSQITFWDTSGFPVLSNNVLVTYGTGIAGTQGFTKTGSGKLVAIPTSSPITGNIYIENGTIELGGTGIPLGSATFVLGTANSGSATTTLRLSKPANTGGNGSICGTPIVINSAAPASSTALIEGNPLSTTNGNLNATITLQGGRSVMFTNSGTPTYGVNRNISGAGDVIASTTSYTNRIRLNPSSPSTNNTWLGNLRIVSGGVQITDGSGNALTSKNAIPDTDDVIMSANTILAFSANETFGALNGDAAAIVGESFVTNGTAFNMTVGANNHDGVFNGAIWLHDVGVFANANMSLQITKIGSGTQTFNGACSNTAPTYVGGGSLVINGSYAASPITVSNSATLGGVGTLAGAVSVQSGGTLAPGTNNAVGALTINNNLTLAGNLFIKVDKSLATSNSSVAVSGTLNNTGTGMLTMNNLNVAQPFAAGDKFTVFSQPLANGSALTISPANPGAGLAWTNNLALDGSIGVVQSVALNPTNIMFSVSGGTLTLSWPADHLGWHLQMQTNTLAVGLQSTGWVVIPGTDLVTQTNFPISSTNPAVFYRLTYP
jgi:autotransporter-associated beta strand protein